MNREKTQRIALIALVIAIVVAGSYMFVLRPRLAKWREIATGNVELNAKLDEAQTKADSIPRLQRRTRELSEAVKGRESLMVPGGEFSDFLYVIKSAADEAELSLENVQPREDIGTIKRGAYDERWVRIQTEAAYHALGRFMAALERSSPYLRVVEAEVRAQSGDTGNHSAYVTVSFLVKPTGKQ